MEHIYGRINESLNYFRLSFYIVEKIFKKKFPDPTFLKRAVVNI